MNGIWGKYTDTNDVNATDAAFNHNVLVTGDDFGLVKLFNFPSVRKGGCWDSLCNIRLRNSPNRLGLMFFRFRPRVTLLGIRSFF